MASKVSGLIEYIKPGGSSATSHAIASTAYGYCETAAGTAIKNVDMTGFKLEEGVTVHIKFANANSADNPKLKFNSEADLNAKPIVQYGTTAAGKTSETNGWYAGAVLTLTYDGTSWVRDQGFNTNTHKYHTTGSWSGLTYTATAVNSAEELKFTIPTGTTATTVATGNHTHSTQQLTRPNQLNGMNDVTLQSLVSTVRANRLAFLPASQVIIEQTTDAGVTWTDAGVNDTIKAQLFAEQRPGGVNIPKLNGVKDINCGLRITFTAMRYNVPDGTPETQKYQYWNSQYVDSQERYCNLKEFYFWLGSNSDGIQIKVERATGADSNNWSTIFENTNWAATGWSGNDYIRFSQSTFGGGTNQTGNYWNYRITFFTRNNQGGTTLSTSSTTSAQAIYEIRGYGDTWWNKSNNLMAEDRLYTFDANKNATFPANITAPKFIGALQGAADKATAANLTTTVNAVAYYTNTTGTFGSKASADGVLYATSANGALNWGTLPIAQGGTGKTTAQDAANALISGLPTWTATPTADTYFIRRDTGGTATFGQVKFSTIANINNGVITLGPNTITPVTSVNGHTGSSVSITAADLGLSGAMHFRGKATVTITENSTTDPSISGYTFGTNGTSALAGDVILDKDAEYEYVWTENGTSGKWEKLGGSSSYALDDHQHDISITQTGTSTVNLAANTTYTLTAGGKSVVFKTPTDENTWTAMVGASSSSNGAVGYVNAVPPKDGYNTKFLRADSSWNTAVTSITIKTTSPINGGSNTATTTTGTYTITHDNTDGNKHVPANGTTNNGNFLKATGTAGTYEWSALPIADTNTAGIMKLGASGGAAAYSHSHGNITVDGKITSTATIANGDKLVIVDSDSTADSKITGSSITFDGSTETQCLTKKGTWKTFGTSNLTIGTTDSTAMAGNTVVTNVNYSSTTAKAYLMASTDAPTATATACEAKGDQYVYLVNNVSGGLSASKHYFNITGTDKAYIEFNGTDQSLDFVFA